MSRKKYTVARRLLFLHAEHITAPGTCRLPPPARDKRLTAEATSSVETLFSINGRVQTNGLQYWAEIWGFNQERSSIGNESTAGAKMVKVIDDSGLVPALTHCYNIKQKKPFFIHQTGEAQYSWH
jgi:hypothetical protein